MPVKIGDNLTLDDNKLSAVYKELYTKLNKACAWTHNQSTSSGGTVELLYNGTLYNTLQCENMNLFYTETYMNGGNKLCIISGKLYLCSKGALEQIGTKSNYKMCTLGTSKYGFGIDIDNNLFYFSNNNLTQIGNGITWSYLSGQNSSSGYAIGDGKLYQLSSTSNPVQIGNSNKWEKIIYSSGYHLGICDGYVCRYNGTSVISSSINNIIDIVGYYIDTSTWKNGILALGNNDKLYIGNITSSSIDLTQIQHNLTNITKITDNISTGVYGYIIADKKLYKISISTSASPSNASIALVNSTIEWKDVVGDGSKGFGIGVDGKLYTISGSTITQFGEYENYQKILGYPSEIILAWTGSPTSASYTVYSSKHPEINDILYSDLNLTKYSTCNYINGSIIRDEYREYIRDGYKDKSFIGIPSATTHETVSVADLLNATNPNN